jgi:hypothetical protein
MTSQNQEEEKNPSGFFDMRVCRDMQREGE